MQINTGRMFALMRRNGMEREADLLERGEQAVGSICEVMALDKQDPARGQMQEGTPCGAQGRMGNPPAATWGLIPGVVPGSVIPACYNDCDAPNPCLIPYLENQALEIDPWSLLEYYKNESDIVHVKKSVGAAPFVAGPGLASNQEMLLVQEDGQVLAFIPGLLKVAAKFSDGKDHQELLDLTLYAGARGLTGLTTTDTASGLVVIGRPFTFQDFVCGTSCYLAPWPKLFNCRNRVIPGQRAVYAKVRANALPDGVTVESVSVTIIKADTPQYANCCNQFKITPNN